MRKQPPSEEDKRLGGGPAVPHFVWAYFAEQQQRIAAKEGLKHCYFTDVLRKLAIRALDLTKLDHYELNGKSPPAKDRH